MDVGRDLCGGLGDQQSHSELVDAGKARQQIVQLMAFFEESPHTRLLEKYLLWDESRSTTLAQPPTRTSG
ncbi:MAG: hypothetical protein R3C56_16780 [Pirellulaceae bacterium]